MTSLILSIPYILFIFHCLLSMVLGGFIGFERAYKHKPAGLKTHILICMGATAITYLSINFGDHGDPGRIAAQIVSGIGFIGGGAILHSNKVIQGITTASTLWVSAAIGMLVGASMVFPAIFFTAMCLIILLISNKFSSNREIRSYYSLIIEINNPDILKEIITMSRKYELTIETKRVLRKKGISVEISYHANPLSHHLFMKKLLLSSSVSSVLAV